MKIVIAQVPPEGMSLIEDIPAETLDLATEIVKFRGPVRVKAAISRITNALTVDLDIAAELYCTCSRCVDGFEISLNKHVQLNYPLDKTFQTLDLDPDIRQEIILEYPHNPLCTDDCKGLCATCGKNLNDGPCACRTD
ncbi:MAG: DUF177 domain-containing protein [Candidatus Omnitrophica bacterium]|nr:DUF177 domain-containing protein [Candidatus Omnitrophota bacterium]